MTWMSVLLIAVPHRSLSCFVKRSADWCIACAGRVVGVMAQQYVVLVEGVPDPNEQTG